MGECIIRIKESIDSISGKEKDLGNYILNNVQDVLGMNIEELSKNAKCSTATVVRFCDRLGFDGYKDFLMKLCIDSLTPEANIGKNSKIKNRPLIEQVTEINIKSLEDTISILDKKQVDKAVSMINGAKRIYIFSNLSSAMVSEDLGFKLERLGYDCKVYHEHYEALIATTQISDKDVVIAISYSGESKTLVPTISKLKKKGIKIVSITKFGKNSLSNLADARLSHASVGDGSVLMTTRSRVVQNNIIDILFVSLAQKREASLKATKKLEAEAYNNN